MVCINHSLGFMYEIMGSGILQQQIPLTMELVAKDNENEDIKGTDKERSRDHFYAISGSGGERDGLCFS